MSVVASNGTPPTVEEMMTNSTRLSLLGAASTPAAPRAPGQASVGWHRLPTEIHERIVYDAVLSPLDRMRLSAVNKALQELLPLVPYRGITLPDHRCAFTPKSCLDHFCAQFGGYHRVWTVNFEAKKNDHADGPAERKNPCSLFDDRPPPACPSPSESTVQACQRDVRDVPGRGPRLAEGHHAAVCHQYAAAGDPQMLSLVLRSLDPDARLYQYYAGDECLSRYGSLRSALHQSHHFAACLGPSKPSRVVRGVTNSHEFFFSRPDSADLTKHSRRHLFCFRACLDGQEEEVDTLMAVVRLGTVDEVRMALAEGYPVPEQVRTTNFFNWIESEAAGNVQRKVVRYETPWSAARSAEEAEPGRSEAIEALLRAAGAAPAPDLFQNVWTRLVHTFR